MQKEKTIKNVYISEFKIDDLPLSCTWFIVGCPGSGKSTLIDNLVYYNKHKYPVARAFSGTDTGYKELSKRFHSLYVSNYYDEEEEKRHIRRQRMCGLE